MGNETPNVRFSMNNELKISPGLNIWEIQAGIGKSTLIINKTKKSSGKTLIIVPNHELAKSTYKELIIKKNVAHWQGWNQICPKRKNDDHIIKVKNAIPAFPTGKVCESVCTKRERDKCPYIKQFWGKPKVIITVPEFQKSALKKLKEGVTDKNEIQIFFDECVERFETVEYNKNEINKILKIMGLNFDSEDESNIDAKKLLEIWDNTTYELFKPCFELLFEHAMKKKDVKLLEEVFKVNPPTINAYHKIYTKNNVDMNYFHIPHIFKAFELAADGYKVVISDATFNEAKFDLLEKTWEKEIIWIDEQNPAGRRSLWDFPVTVYSSSVKNKDYSIFHFNDPFFKEHTYKNHYDFIINLMKYLEKRGQSSAMITNEQQEGKFINAPCDIYHYNGTRGLNDLQHYDNIFIVSRPMMPNVNVLRELNGIMRRNEELYNSSEIKKIDGYWYDKGSGEQICDTSFVNSHSVGKSGFSYGIHNESRYRIESEIYQDIHRSRGLVGGKAKLWLFGTCPEKIFEEFTVKPVSFDEIRRETNKELYSILGLWMKINENFNKFDELDVVARKMDLYKKRKSDGLNTNFVETMLDISRKQIQTLSECYGNYEEKLPFEIDFPAHYGEKIFMDDLHRYTQK